MGSEPLILDHVSFWELWLDPYFWEHVPKLEVHRERAEFLANHDASPFGIRHSQLYNQWLEQLRDWQISDPESLQRFVAYIQQKRRRNNEPIWLTGTAAHPNFVVLFSGVAPWPHIESD